MPEKATLAKLLALTRRVFAGQVTRAALMHHSRSRRLSDYSTREQVFVAVAIMLAAGDRFLSADYMVNHSYANLLEDLLSAGIANTVAGERGFKFASVLAAASRDSGLHRRLPGRSGASQIQLTPPPQLVTLVRQLGCTPAVAAFLHDATEGIKRDRAWRAEAGTPSNLPPGLSRHLQDVIRQTNFLYGRMGVQNLRDALDHWLQTHPDSG